MRSIVDYESRFRNTEVIGEAVADGLRRDFGPSPSGPSTHVPSRLHPYVRGIPRDMTKEPTMKTFATKRTAGTKSQPTTSEPIVALKRRTIDSVLIAFGAVLTVALVVAGSLLTWGANFAADYVDDELSSQNIQFPPAAELREEGRTDLVKFAGQAVNTGPEAEAYASFIDGHLRNIAEGATYADLGDPESAAKDAVKAAQAGGADQATIAELQGKADAISGQRNTLFKGETLRGLLLTAFAWATVGRIAGYAAFGAFLAGAAMLVLVLLGLRHHHKVLVRQN